MITVAIELAENGVIKIVHDDNVNGAGEEFESRRVYDFDGIDNVNSKISFLNELVMDLGMDMGTDLDASKVIIKTEWGSKYTPTKEQASYKIKELEKQIKNLEKYVK